MKKLPLIVTCLSISCSMIAKNSFYEQMMQDRRKILMASQETTTPDPFTSNTPDQQTPESLSYLTKDEDRLAQELAAVLQNLDKLPLPSTQKEDIPFDQTISDEPE